MKKASIITVCYNSEGTIRRTIESVLNQSYSNYEYIIVDGQSTDETLRIISEYETAFDEKLIIISEPDNGIYDAMNKGISRASGEMIGILNSDDYYEPNAIQDVIDAMTTDSYQILYGFMRSWKDEMEYSISRQSHLFLETEMINHPACFVTKAVYNDFGMYSTEYVSVADYDFMLRMSKNVKVKFIPVDSLLANFTLGGMSASDAAWKDLLKLKRNYHFISSWHYYKETGKSMVYNIFHKTRK